jgi:hypothetical protein
MLRLIHVHNRRKLFHLETLRIHASNVIKRE